MMFRAKPIFLLQKQYRTYFIASVVLHSLVLVLLVSNISFTKIEKFKVALDKPKKAEVIKAVAIDNELVIKEVTRLEKLEQDKKQKEIQRQQKLKDELAKLEKQKVIEQKKIAEEKRKAKELKKQQEELVKNAKKAKQELAKKKEEQQKLEQELKQEQKRKQAIKEQEELLAKLKKEEEDKLLESLSEEEDIVDASNRRRSFVEREIERYIALQRAKVERNWISRDSFLGKGLVTKLEIRLADDGRVINVKIVKGSGNAALDTSAKNAILKASPLPLPDDQSLRKNFMHYRFTFRPDDLS